MSPPRPGEHAFDLSGGASCLDFVNTVGGRGREAPVERLRGYADLVAWARQAGLVDARRAAALARRGAERPREAARALTAAVELREALFRLFAAAAAGRRPPAADLAVLNRWLPRALGRLRLALTGPTGRAGRPGDAFVWRWADEPAARRELDAPLWPVARSAADLLAGGELSNLRECAAAGCRWLFLDRSRNHSRRWCDMKACGNREKVRRHYRRQRRRLIRRAGSEAAELPRFAGRR
jgi:predicted RNA-binding Zn ribbon-like protein